MKLIPAILTVALLAGCDAPKNQTSDSGSEPSPPPATTPMPAGTTAPSAAITASANGTVQSVDQAAQSIVIAHGPVESLKWPAMTMTFQAPGVDLSSIKAGDEVSFEFTSTGIDGTIVSIAKK